MDANEPLKGRGAATNPFNRFERIEHLPNEEDPPEDSPSPQTLFFKDSSKSALAHNDSPDIPFRSSLNPYRGCEHGCIYCYARPTHEYLGFSAGLDFETKIMVKENAPELLRQELSKKTWEPQVVAISGVTDPYQPIERRLKLTRRCLEVLLEFRNPVAVITKNHLVARDADLFAKMAQYQGAEVFLSITTLDAELARTMEPRTSRPDLRLDAIKTLRAAGVPAGVMVAPVIPGLTDHELPAILKAAAKAGAQSAGFVPLRLPFGVKELFEKWLAQNYPDRQKKVLNQVRSMRGGKLNDSHFGSRMRGEGVLAKEIEDLFDLARRKAGIPERGPELSTDSFRRPTGPQLDFFA